jgi:PPM family protein phosphatase
MPILKPSARDSAVQNAKTELKLKAWGDTHPGNRENNEDRILCEPERGIFIVADGMGGEAAGEVAAQHAVNAIAARLHQETGSVERRMREAIAGANNEIYRMAEGNPSWRGMACVLSIAVVKDGMLHIGHVGDSRIYRISRGKIRKLTSDHSPVGQREDAGQISEPEAMRHPRRNEVFRDVGSQPHKPDDADFIEYIQTPFEKDSALILCSDGLSDMIASKEILQTTLDRAGEPRDCVRILIEQANAAGGKDNISVITVEGENFAASCANQRIPSKRIGSLSFSFLRRRWFFLLYGLIAGLLASLLWTRTAPIQEEIPVPQVDQAAKALTVEPSSPEYPTISKALESARPGDRIEIGDGEYPESIRLKEGVELAARSPGKAILRFSQIVPGSSAAISADGIKQASVSGLVVKADPGAGLSYGIRMSNSNVRFTNMEISGAGSAGILIEGNSSGEIVASYVYQNSGPGFLVAGEANPLLVGNVVYANGLSRNKNRVAPGLHITDRSNPEVKRNVFSGNGAEPIWIQRQELKQKMMDNMFTGFTRPARAIVLDQVQR